MYDNISRILLRREIFQTKSVEKIKTHILCSETFFPKNRAIYDVMWQNTVEADRPQMTM